MMSAQLQNLVYYALMGVAIYFMFRRGGCCGGGHTASHHMSGGGCCGGGHQHGNGHSADDRVGQTTEMVKDPICGMTIPKNDAIRINMDGKDYYFCSEDCANEFRKRGGQS